MFQNKTVFRGEEAKKAHESLPDLPVGLAYHWEESDHVRSFLKGKGVFNEIRFTLGKIEMVFLTQHHPKKGEIYTFTVTDKRYGLSNSAISSVSELTGLIKNEIKHLTPEKEYEVVV